MSGYARTLRRWATHEVVASRPARRVVAVAAVVLATTFCAYVAVPLPGTTVPMTLQPLVVLLAGALLGARMGAVALGTYVVVGALGAPVFSNGHGGLPWLLGPTGGYLFAYPAAAFVTGWLAGSPEAGRLRLLGALAAGLAVIYVGGISQLAVLSGREPGALLAVGVLPFLAGDVVKILIALVLARRLRPASLGRF